MQRKTKINVLLPIRLVGELDSLSRAGKRSTFIEQAIKDKLNEETYPRLSEIPTKQILVALTHREDISEFVRKTVQLELKLE
tara:strand:- start:2722 stop:2967 length:246 start_codon:yes stop_codon:yes gene_type:complete